MVLAEGIVFIYGFCCVNMKYPQKMEYWTLGHAKIEIFYFTDIISLGYKWG